MVLNIATTAGDQIRLNYISNNKFETVPEIWLPQKRTGEHISLELS